MYLTSDFMKTLNNLNQILGFYLSNQNQKINVSKILLETRIKLIGIIAIMKLLTLKQSKNKKASDRLKMYSDLLDSLNDLDRIESNNYSPVLLICEIFRENIKLKKENDGLKEKASQIQRFYEAS